MKRSQATMSTNVSLAPIHKNQLPFLIAQTVALVNIPMSIALSISAGSTPNAGIVTAFWAGLMSAIFGGL